MIIFVHSKSDIVWNNVGGMLRKKIAPINIDEKKIIKKIL